MPVENHGSRDLSVEQVMAGVLAMLIAEREDRLAALDSKTKFAPRKTELILSNAGLTAHQIGGLLGKKPNTIQKTISRAQEKSDVTPIGASDE